MLCTQSTFKGPESSSQHPCQQAHDCLVIPALGNLTSLISWGTHVTECTHVIIIKSNKSKTAFVLSMVPNAFYPK